jgi:hypothetical protein
VAASCSAILLLQRFYAMADVVGRACCLLSAVNLSRWQILIFLLCGRSENPINQIDLGAHEDAEQLIPLSPLLLPVCNGHQESISENSQRPCMLHAESSFSASLDTSSDKSFPPGLKCLSNDR